MYVPPSYVNNQFTIDGKNKVTCAKMTQLLGIQALWIPMWHVIMIRHKKNGNWKIWIMVNFYINDFQITNRCNDMEYNDQSNYPIIVNLATSIAPYNDEC
jgi:hypothetical protein